LLHHLSDPQSANNLSVRQDRFANTAGADALVLDVSQAGKANAAVWGTTHGPQVGDFQLYDVQAGKMIAEVSGDVETQSLNSQAPEWAKQVEQEMHQRR
jgi:hypothetical protein